MQDDWIKTDADRKAVEQGYWFDESAAERVRSFFRLLCHSKGKWAGQPFELLPWQWERVIAPVFGWRGPDGLRRFRKVYIEVPKKNGKSALMSGLGLYLLVGDGEQGAEVYTAAADRDQASIIYGESANMVEASPSLSKHVMVVRSQKRLVFPRTNSVLKALSADVPTKEGLNASAVIFDELHAQKSRDLWDTLYYAGAAREQPLLISITTAGTNRESICYEQRDYAEQVADGRIEDLRFLPVIYQADPERWTDPDEWAKANPSLGETISLDSFREACVEAQASPRKENSFKRYRLNIWTDSAERWISSEDWSACAGDLGDLTGRECYGGLDLSATTDLTSFALCFPREDGFDLLVKTWIPAERVGKKEKDDRVPYSMWVRDGSLLTTPGNVVDYDSIHAAVIEAAEQYNLHGVAYDPWNATQAAVKLEAEGVEMLEFRQGYRTMSGPAKAFEAAVLDHKARHNDNPVLNWMVGNTMVEMDPAENIKPSKKKSTQRIDGVVASVMAYGLALAANDDDDTSVYEDRGLLTL